MKFLSCCIVDILVVLVVAARTDDAGQECGRVLGLELACTANGDWLSLWRLSRRLQSKGEYSNMLLGPVKHYYDSITRVFSAEDSKPFRPYKCLSRW